MSDPRPGHAPLAIASSGRCLSPARRIAASDDCHITQRTGVEYKGLHLLGRCLREDGCKCVCGKFGQCRQFVQVLNEESKRSPMNSRAVEFVGRAETVSAASASSADMARLAAVSAKHVRVGDRRIRRNGTGRCSRFVPPSQRSSWRLRSRRVCDARVARCRTWNCAHQAMTAALRMSGRVGLQFHANRCVSGFDWSGPLNQHQRTAWSIETSTRIVTGICEALLSTEYSSVNMMWPRSRASVRRRRLTGCETFTQSDAALRSAASMRRQPAALPRSMCSCEQTDLAVPAS